MSICRWSTDNFKCDLYVYESDQGIEICVAGMRIVEEIPDYWHTIDKSPEEFAAAYKAHREAMEACTRCRRSGGHPARPAGEGLSVP